MRKLYLVTTLSGFVAIACSQSWFPLSHPLSIGGTSVTDIHRPGVFTNPAHAVNFANPLLFAVYDNRYGITELASKGLRFSYPFTHFSSSLDVRYSGFGSYHELLGGLSFARNFGGKFSMGLQFIVESRYAVESDRYYSALYPQLGITVPLSETLLLGVSVINPFATAMLYESETRSLASVYSVGVRMRFSESVCWRLQADQEISNRLRWGTAFEFDLLDKITVQAGVQHLDFFVPALGVGFAFSNLQFDLVSSLHPFLGPTAAGGLSYHFRP